MLCIGETVEKPKDFKGSSNLDSSLYYCICCFLTYNRVCYRNDCACNRCLTCIVYRFKECKTSKHLQGNKNFSTKWVLYNTTMIFVLITLFDSIGVTVILLLWESAYLSDASLIHCWLSTTIIDLKPVLIAHLIQSAFL